MKKILKNAFLVLLILVTMSIFTGCLLLDEDDEDDNSGGSNTNAALIEKLESGQDALYNVFKTLYDEIDGRMYYSDIGYYMDTIEINLRDTDLKISETFPTGSMYYVRWIGYVKIGYTSYKLVYLEVQFNSNFLAKKKQMGRYSIN